MLFILLKLWWWLRKRNCQPASSSKEGSSRNKVDKEEKKKPSVALDMRGMLPGGSQHPWVLVQEPEMAAVRG